MVGNNSTLWIRGAVPLPSNLLEHHVHSMREVRETSATTRFAILILAAVHGLRIMLSFLLSNVAMNTHYVRELIGGSHSVYASVEFLSSHLIGQSYL